MAAASSAFIFNLYKFNIFNSFPWTFIFGAAGCLGWIAGLGYFFSSLHFHKKPTVALLLAMIVIAAAMLGLIYYIEYSILVSTDGRCVANSVGFGQYLDTSLTKGDSRIGCSIDDAGKANSFGYWVALLHFTGIVAGKWIIYEALQDQAFCLACNFYLHRLSNKRKIFAKLEEAAPYHDNLFATAVDSPEFAEKIRKVAVAPAKQGAFRIETVLLGCAGCKSQMIVEQAEAYDGNEWKSTTKFGRCVSVPSGIDLRSVFRA